MTTLTNYEGHVFDLNLYFSHTFKGRGGWNINIEAECKGQKFKTYTYTTDSMFIDKVQGMKSMEENASFEEIQETYSDKFLDNFKERLIEWCESLTETEDN